MAHIGLSSASAGFVAKRENLKGLMEGTNGRNFLLATSDGSYSNVI